MAKFQFSRELLDEIAAVQAKGNVRFYCEPREATAKRERAIQVGQRKACNT